MGILSVVHSKISRGRKRIDFFYRALAFFLISTLVLTVVPSSVLAKTSLAKSKKETPWLLEFTWVAKGTGGQVTITGEVRFLVPKGGGRVEAEGPMNLTEATAKLAKELWLLRETLGTKG